MGSLVIGIKALGMRSLIFIFLFFSLSFDAIAASATATGVTTVYKDATGVARVAEVMTKMSSVTYGVKYALQRVAVSPASMGRMAVRAVGGPWGAAIVAGMALYSYRYDEDSRSFIIPDTLYACPGGDYCDHYDEVGCWSASGSSGCYPNFASALGAVVSLYYPNEIISEIRSSNDIYHVYSSSNRLNNIGFIPANTPNKPDDPYKGDVTYISDEDIGQHIFDNVDSGAFSSSLPQNIASDSVNTGNYSQDWPELQDHLSNLTDSLTQADDGTNTFTQTDEASFRDPGDKPSTTSNTYSGSLDFPNDYNREATQQEILNKLKEAPPAIPSDLGADVPLIDWQTVNLPDLDDSQFDSISGGGCPSDISLSVLGQSFSISYQPFCDLAIKLNPFFVALGWLSAAFIVFGGKSIV